MGLRLLIIFAVHFIIISANSELRNVENLFVKFDSKAEPNCGIQKEQKIMGGTETKAGEFPWVAALEYIYTENNENAGINCGGSVVSPRYIITAAHCIHPSRMEIIKVWVGVLRLSQAETIEADRVQKLNIEEQIRHENFNTPKGANDIGLLRLASDITFNDYVGPICTPTKDLAPPPLGTLMSVAGWGNIGNGTYSDIKLKVKLPLVSNEICTNGLNLPLSDTQLCLGGENNKDSCNGDSGGPLMLSFVSSGKTYWYQPGIVSFGRSCGGTASPLGAYTRVSKFIDWIKNNIH